MKKYVFAALLIFMSLLQSYAQKLETAYVFLITLDGLRWQELYEGADSTLIRDERFVKEPANLEKIFWAETAEERRSKLMPFFWSEINEKGQLYGNRKKGSHVSCSNSMWFSYPGYNEILTGYADDERITSNQKTPNENITILEYVNNQKDFKGKVAAFGSWDVFPYIINEDRSGIPVNAGFEKSTDKPLSEKEELLNTMIDQIPKPWYSVRFDAFTHHYAMEYIKKHNPRLLYISYGETDDYAHDGRYDQYLKSARRTDQYIKEIWEYIQSSKIYKDKTTLLITTDHGRGTVPKETWTSHSNKIPGADQIWIAVIGPDTKALGEDTKGTYTQSQIARSVTDMLGVKYDEPKAAKRINQLFK